MKKISCVILICALLLVCLNAWGCSADQQTSKPAGLYNASDECLYTWEELVNNYGMNVEQYQSQSSDEKPATISDLLRIYPELKAGTKLIMPDNVRRIGESAFKNWKQLEYIEIGKNVTIIDSDAFYGCSSLKHIDIPDKLTIIESCAFYGCSLESVTLPDGLKTIGTQAFSECDLTSIVIPSSVTTTGVNVFALNDKNMVIFCEATSKPADWSSTWAAYIGGWDTVKFNTVYWGNEWHYIDGIPTPK